MSEKPRDPVADLQKLLVQGGLWLPRLEAQDLYAEVAHGGLTEDRFVEEAMARSRPLTAEERAKLQAAGMVIPDA